MSRDPAVRRLAAELAQLRGQVRDLQTQPRFGGGYSSFEGSIQQYALDGQTVVQRIGRQFDGTNTTSFFSGPVPPAPSLPHVVTQPGGMTVRWDGEFAGDVLVAPMDFQHVEIHISTDAGFIPSRETLRTTIATPQGGQATFALPQDVHHVRLLTRSQSGKPSDATAQITGTPLPIVDPEALSGLARIRVESVPPDKDAPGNTRGDVWWIADDVTGRITEQWVWSSSEWVKTEVDGVMLAADTIAARHMQVGSVTAAALSADLVLATEIIAGSPVGSHARMGPAGFRVFASDPVDNIPNEVVRMGTQGDDYFAVVRDDGSLAASISQGGVGSFRAGSFRDEVTIAGRRLLGGNAPFYALPVGVAGFDSWVEAMPWGLVGWGSVQSSSLWTDNVPGVGIFELDVTMVAGRMYKLCTSPLRVTSTGHDPLSDPLAEIRIVGTATKGTMDAPPVLPVAPTVNSPIYGRLNKAVSDRTGEGFVIAKLHAPVQGEAIVPGDLYRRRLLLVVTRPLGDNAGGWVRVEASGLDPAEFWVEDIGPVPPNGGQANNGGGSGTSTPEAQTPPPPPPPPTAPPRRSHTSENVATYLRSYRGNNETYLDGQAYQGYGGSSYVGVSRSMIGFPDLTGELAGATIENIEVYLNFTHWWNNAGGTAVIGIHGHLGIPTTYSPAWDDIVRSAGWPKPGSRWVQLPSHLYGGFASGVYRGITLRPPGDSTNREFYGIVNDARIRVTFSK
jgi:hypothetical protein